VSGRVRVVRNPAHTIGMGDEQPWFVVCDHCAGGDGEGGIFGLMQTMLGGPGRLGWAPTWTAAQAYADQHARRHEETRCPTCHRTVAEPTNPDPQPTTEDA
jgi:hypothetical protein